MNHLSNKIFIYNQSNTMINYPRQGRKGMHFLICVTKACLQGSFENCHKREVVRYHQRMMDHIRILKNHLIIFYFLFFILHLGIIPKLENTIPSCSFHARAISFDVGLVQLNLWHDVLCILGEPPLVKSTFTPNPNLKVQFYEFNILQ